jgi:alpha-tubulin suppressor-like RCC1 family protein
MPCVPATGWARRARSVASALSRALVRAAAVAPLGLALSLPVLALATPARAHAAVGGELYVAGANEHGQLGDGTNVMRLSVEPAPNFGFPVVAAAGGLRDTFALLANGTVAASGAEEYGSLGDGVSLEGAMRSLPELVPGLSNVTGIAAGENYFALALLSNGTVIDWGHNSNGELGLGNTVEQDRPAQVPGLGPVVQVAAGCRDGYVLLSDGRVESFGDNAYGLLGDGFRQLEQSASATPVEVKGLEDVVALAPGCNTVYALRADGTVWSWGDGEYGQLGDGSSVPPKEQPVPVQVKGLEHAVAIAGANEAGYALLAGGTVADWGYNHYGELGDGTVEEHKEPEIVPGLTGVRAIGASAEDGYAVLADGAVYGWGNDRYGQLGDGTAEEQKPPEALPAPPGVVGLGTGSDNFDLLAIVGAAASLSGTSLSFPTAPVGAASAARTVTLTDDGPAPLAVSGDVLTGPGAGSFARSADTCSGATLAPGSSCTVALVFTPAAAGPASAALAFSTSAANVLPAVMLSGTGSAAAPAVRPAPPRLSRLAVRPRSFRLAGRRSHGRCAPPRRHGRPRRAARCERHIALRVSFVLSAAASVRFRSARVATGRLVGSRCVVAARSRRGRRCKRLVPLPGSITRAGRAGSNRIVLHLPLRRPGARRARRARLSLAPGRYRLLATPYARGHAGVTVSAAFRLVR